MRYNNKISITFIKDFANKKVGEVIECDCTLARDLVLAKHAKYTEIKRVADVQEVVEVKKEIKEQVKKAKKGK